MKGACTSCGLPPTVSVAMITYRQEAYIAQAVESALTQETTFEVEIVIGEDCSPDGTRRVLLELEEKYPGRLRLLLHEENLGMSRNLEATLRACRGKYIAILEGDDYWTCSTKLEQQVQALEEDPSCVICFHNVEAIDEAAGSRTLLCRPDQKQRSTFHDLLVNNFIPTCSVLYRNGLIERIPEWMHGLGMADWPLHLLNAEHGDILYLDGVMAAYRSHPGGVWSSRGVASQCRQLVRVYECIDAHFGGQYHREIAQLKRRYSHPESYEYRERGLHALMRGDYRAAWAAYWQALRRCPTALAEPQLLRDLLALCKRSVLARSPRS
jgi:glycosyltransferase involved in cell wall biosynthesis